MAGESGMGVTIAFATSLFAGKITGIGGGELVREWYDNTHMSSASGSDHPLLRWMEQVPADLGSVNDFTVDPGPRGRESVDLLLGLRAVWIQG